MKVLLLLLLAPTLLARQATAPPTLQSTAQDVASYIRPDPGGVAALFAPAFLAQVPAAQLAAIFKQLYAAGGTVTSVTLATSTNPSSGVFNFRFQKSLVSRVTLTINRDPVHNIVGLLFGPLQPAHDDWAALETAMRQLPGQVSFQAQRLEAGTGSTVLAELDPQRPLAIGSAFKLYILGALATAAEQGQRHWDQVIPLATHSLPSGQLQKWPLGTPVTLQTLASLMISISDNTAADQLLQTLGRLQVEAMLAPMGNEHAARNQPFLSTLDMFLLKFGDSAQRQQYLAASPDARRVRLGHMPHTPPENFLDQVGAAASQPRDLDTLEWFASAADLGRAMAWFRAPSHETARQVLAINPGIPLSQEQWSYIGFKGGSEAGVISLNFLLRSHDGAWFTLSAIWNNPQAEVNESQWVALVTRALALLPTSKAA